METRWDRGDIQEKMESTVCECKCHVNGFQIPILLRSRATVVLFFIVQIIKKAYRLMCKPLWLCYLVLTLVGYAMIWQSEVELIKNIYRKSSYLIFAKIFFPS